MKRYLPSILFAVFAALFVATIAGAQPALTQRRVTGTCGAGNAIRTVNADGTVTCQQTASGTGTTSNLVRWNNTSGAVVDSVVYEEPSESRVTVPQRMHISVNLADTSTQHGAMTVQSTGTGLTINDGGIQSFHNGAYNIGGGGAQAFSIYGNTTATNSAGPMINTGCSCSASLGTTNYSMYGGAGTLRNDGAALLGTPVTIGSGAAGTGNQLLLHSDLEIDSGQAVSLGNTVGNFAVPTGRILLGASALSGPIQMTNASGGGAASIISHYANTNLDANAYAGNRIFRGTAATLRAGVNVGAGGSQFANGDTTNALVIWSYDAGGVTYGIELATGSGPDVRVRITPQGSTNILGDMEFGDAEADKIHWFGKVYTRGTAPTLSACGTSPPSVVGNDKAGTVTMGTGTPAACTVNFNGAYDTNASICVVSSRTAGRSFYISAASTSAITVTQDTTADSSVFTYICVGRL